MVKIFAIVFRYKAIAFDVTRLRFAFVGAWLAILPILTMARNLVTLVSRGVFCRYEMEIYKLIQLCYQLVHPYSPIYIRVPLNGLN